MRVQEGRDAGDVTKGIDMSSKDVDAAAAGRQSFHPEFGYLCPSPRTRRKVRSVAMTIAAGLSIAAGTALALVPQLAPPTSGDVTRAASALSDTAISPTGIPAILVNGADPGGAGEWLPLPTMHAPAVTDRAAGARAGASCDDPSGAFLAPQCQAGKTGKSHMMRAARAPASRVATVPVGRADAGLEAEPQNVEAASSLATEPAATAFAMNEALPLPRARPAAAAKKAITTAQKQAPVRDTASAAPSAAAPSPGFDLFALFHQPSRTGSSAWAMSWAPRP
jgi:hypothetical protein